MKTHPRYTWVRQRFNNTINQRLDKDSIEILITESRSIKPQGVDEAWETNFQRIVVNRCNWQIETNKSKRLNEK